MRYGLLGLKDMSHYKTSNNNKFRYIFVYIDNYSKYIWSLLLKKKYGQKN